MKKKLSVWIRVLFSLGLLVVLFLVFDLRESFEALYGMRLGYFGLALGLFQITLVIRALRWKVLLQAVQVMVPLRSLIYLYYVGTFFNTFLPSGLGGDAVRMYELGRHSERASEAVGTVLVDRLAGVTILFVMGLLAWPFAYRTLPRQQSLFLLLVSIGGLGAIWMLFQQRLAQHVLARLPVKIRPKLEAVYRALHQAGAGAMRRALGLSVLFNSVLFVLIYATALALGINVSFLYVVAFMPVISLAMLLPSVGALGTRETAYVLMFGSVGVQEPLAIAMSFSYYLIDVLTGIVGVLVYALGTLRDLRSPAIPRP